MISKGCFANKTEAEELLKDWKKSKRHFEKTIKECKDEELIEHAYVMKKMLNRWCCNLKTIIEEFNKETK